MAKEVLYTQKEIRTYTGKYINVFEPRPEDISIMDIAHALSCMPRWGGHTISFYSVAQHSIWVATHPGIEQPVNRLAALLHDASEAYLMDIPKPIKRHLAGYLECEEHLMVAIANKFGFDFPLPEIVHDIDRAALEWEWKNVKLSNEVMGDKPGVAKDYFLYTYKVICDQLNIRPIYD